MLFDKIKHYFTRAHSSQMSPPVYNFQTRISWWRCQLPWPIVSQISLKQSPISWISRLLWCSLASCVRRLKIIIHIAITSRIIDNKLDNWRSDSSYSDSDNICSCCCKLFCTILTEFIARNSWNIPICNRPSIKTLCNLITASWSLTIEWKKVIYLENGKNKPWEGRLRTESALWDWEEGRRETNDLWVVR